MLDYDDESDRFSTGGYSVVSRFGQYFVVSTNPYYPDFRAANDNVYMGTDSFFLVNHLQRLAGSFGPIATGLDLCTGGGIAGQTSRARLPGSTWTGVDLNRFAVNAANFNAELNQVASSYCAVESDLFTAVEAGSI